MNHDGPVLFEPEFRRALQDFIAERDWWRPTLQDLDKLERFARRLGGDELRYAGLFVIRVDRIANPAVAAFLLKVGDHWPALLLFTDALPPEEGWRAFDLGGIAPYQWHAAMAAEDCLTRLVQLAGEAAAYRLMARRHRLPFSQLEDAEAPGHGRLPAASLLTRLKAGRLRVDAEEWTVLAPPIHEAEATARRFRGQPGVLLTTPRALEAAFRRLIALPTLDRTVTHLGRVDPDLSASTRPTRGEKLLVTAFAAAAPVFWIMAPRLVGSLVFLLSTLCFLAVGWLRLRAASGLDLAPRDWQPLPDAGLPAYSILVPLFREAHMVAPLLGHLAALDYPPERREILLLVEAVDPETRKAAEAMAETIPGTRVISVPDGTPRTKPRALCYGLAFAGGDLVTVYDAEDRPDPDQLRRAAAMLVQGPEHLACVQARLEIDRNHTALQSHFALEYAALFSGLLPCLGQMTAPLPLGGTSNHFKRDALEQSGGWDPYNVTEEADLGLRLARFGFTADVLDSRTLEEAPARLKVWFRQRVRWQKGWLITGLIHLSTPRALRRELGNRDALLLLVQWLSMVAAPLAHPFAIVLLVSYAFGFLPLPSGESFFGDMLVMATLLGLLAGYGGNYWLAGRIIRRKSRTDLRAARWSMPLYWLLISAAAWWAIVELLIRPHHWAKTPHLVNEAGEKDGREENLERVKGIEPSS